jgi:PAS domain S-box-containing protein
MLSCALGLLSLVILKAPSARANRSCQVMFALGSFATAVGLVASIWGRKLLTVTMSMLLIALGCGALLAMGVLPALALEPLLHGSGSWKSGPMPLREGWSHYAMALSEIACGLGLILAAARRTPIALASYAVVRVCLWVGAFWQLANIMLCGQVTRLIDNSESAAAQVGIFAAFAVAIACIFRGDRAWLSTFFGPGSRYPLSRSILPIASCPLIGGYLIIFIPLRYSRDSAVLTLLSIETVAACLTLSALIVLRIQCKRPINPDTVLESLQAAPVFVMSTDGIIQYWTNACTNMFGYTAKEAVGEHAPILLKTEYQQPNRQIADAMQTDAVWSGEAHQWTSDGRRLRTLVRLSLCVFEPRDDTKVVATVTNITDADPV